MWTAEWSEGGKTQRLQFKEPELAWEEARKHNKAIVYYTHDGKPLGG